MAVRRYLWAALAAWSLPAFAQTDHEAFVKQAKAELTRDFKDPSSVQYRKTFISDSPGFLVLCGELNGKNSYGAYVGFNRFYIGASQTPGIPGISEIESPRQVASLEGIWPRVCGHNLQDIN